MANDMNDAALGGVNAARACTLQDAGNDTPSVASLPQGTSLASPAKSKTSSGAVARAARAAQAGRASGVGDGKPRSNPIVASASAIPRIEGDAIVPASLRKMIEQSVADATGATFALDPTFGPAVSRLVSVAASMQRRHGHILLEAMALGLEAGGHVTVLREGSIRRIDVCPTARRVVRQLDPDGWAGIDLGYDAAPHNPHDGSIATAPKLIEVDAIVIDRRHGTALAIESKRGAKLGAPALRQLIESTGVVSALLRAHLGRHGRSVTTGDACVLVQHADRGLVVPDPLGTSLSDLDARYGGQAERVVTAATALHARLVREALAPLLQLASKEACGAASVQRRTAAVEPCRHAATKQSRHTNAKPCRNGAMPSRRRAAVPRHASSAAQSA